MEWKPRGPRIPDSTYEWILDGDQWPLKIGIDIADVGSFRARLSRMCQNRGLRYRTIVINGILYVEAFKQRPGDLIPELADQISPWPPEGAATAAPEPSPGQ